MNAAYKNIILADDDADDRDLFAEAVAFVDPSISVTMMRDGEELMDFLNSQSSPCDLIFLDLNMPRKNGKECLIELSGHHYHAGTPVIVYTTSLNPLDVEEAFRRGAASFVRKPNSFEELKQLLAVVLSEESKNLERSKDAFVVNPVFKTLTNE